MTEDRANKLIREAADIMTAYPVETERLYLRLFTPDDLEDFFEYISQKELQRLSGNPEINTRKEARESLEWLIGQNRICPTRFAIALRGTGKVIGNFCVNFYPFLLNDPALEGKKGLSLSFVLNENYQRRGLMTELLKRIIDYFLKEHGFDFLNAGYFDFNEGSKRLQEKAGMHPYIEHTFEHKGEMLNVKEMMICREDLQ